MHMVQHKPLFKMPIGKIDQVSKRRYNQMCYLFQPSRINRNADIGTDLLSSLQPAAVAAAPAPAPIDGCRWLYGEPKEQNYCGKPIIANHTAFHQESYCAEHRPIVWIKSYK